MASEGGFHQRSRHKFAISENIYYLRALGIHIVNKVNFTNIRKLTPKLSQGCSSRVLSRSLLRVTRVVIPRSVIYIDHQEDEPLAVSAWHDGGRDNLGHLGHDPILPRLRHVQAAQDRGSMFHFVMDPKPS